jgi:hypothetical protein
LVVGCVFSSVPKVSLQTVPRAEAWAPFVTLSALGLEPGNVKTWGTDASYVTTKFSRVLEPIRTQGKGPLAGTHGDIWEDIKKLLCSRSLSLSPLR